METTSIFSNRLIELRKERNITQAELAEGVKISRQSIAMYERGARLPDIDILKRIAAFFNVSCDFLVGLVDFHTYEAADISARTGLSEAAVEVLEFYRELNEGADEWDNNTTSALLISDILTSSVIPRSFPEFLKWTPPWFRRIWGEHGEYIGDLICSREKNGNIKFGFYRENEKEGIQIHEITPSELLPESFVTKLYSAYDQYCNLNQRTALTVPLLDDLRAFYGFNFDHPKKRLLVNPELSIFRTSGGILDETLEELSFKNPFMDDVCAEDTPGIISLSVSDLMDSRTADKIRISLATLREANNCRISKRLKEDIQQEAADAQEE